MADFNNFSFAETESSPIISQYSFINKPQIHEKLFDTRPMEGDLGDFMKAGLMKKYNGEEIIHHEQNKLLYAPFVNTSATVAQVYGTATFKGVPNVDYIQLAPASHTPVNGPLAGTKSYPRVGQLIQFENLSTWRIQGKDTSTANAHRLYIQRVSSATAPYNATLATTIPNNAGTHGGNQFSVFASAFEEATYGQQVGLLPSFTQYKNYFQTFSERYDVTDIQRQQEIYELDMGGKKVRFLYIKGMDDTEKRFMIQETAGLFLTPKDSDNLVSYNPDGTVSAVTTTQAFMPQLQLQAQKINHGNAITIDLFRTIARLKKKLYQQRKSIFYYGNEFGYQIQNMIVDFGKQGSIVYNQKALDLGFNEADIAGNVYFFKELDILSHPDLTAVGAMPYPYYFIIAPVDKQADAKNPSVMHDAMTIMYKQQVGRGARGHYKIWDTGANTEAGTDSQLITRIHMASRKGFQLFGASRFILGRPA